jgi:hypothetical protein
MGGPYLSPDPTIQRADVDTPIQTVQNFVSGPDRVMGSSPLVLYISALVALVHRILVSKES